MNAPLFRHQVIEAGRERLTGTVVAATPPGARLYLVLVLVVVALLGALLVFGQYSTRATARGIVAFDGGIARVYPNAPGEIRAVHVREGQEVAAGAPLITLALAQGPGGMAEQATQLGRQDEELARQQALATSVAGAEIRSLEAQRGALAAAIAALERQRTLATGQVRLAEAAVRRATQLAAAGAGTQRAVEDSRATLLARRAEAESLAERLATQQQAQRLLETGVAERRLEGERRRAELGGQRAVIAEQRVVLQRSDSLVLTAPTAGRVGDLAAELGQRARPETSLVTLVPGGSRLEVWIYADSEAAAFIRPGQDVRLQFDAYPSQRFGTGRGTVTAVSQVPVEPSSVDPGLEITAPVFRVRVAIADLPPRVPGGLASLRPGTTLTANLILQRRALWEALFNPLAAAFAA